MKYYPPVRRGLVYQLYQQKTLINNIKPIPNLNTLLTESQVYAI